MRGRRAARSGAVPIRLSRDDEVLETLHYGLASRRMIAWSRSLSEIRKELGFLGAEEKSEDLIDVGEDRDFGR